MCRCVVFCCLSKPLIHVWLPLLVSAVRLFNLLLIFPANGEASVLTNDRKQAEAQDMMAFVDSGQKIIILDYRLIDRFTELW